MTSSPVWRCGNSALLCFYLWLLHLFLFLSVTFCLSLSRSLFPGSVMSLFLHPFLVSSCILVCISVIVFVCHFLLCPPWFISRFCSAVLPRCFHSTLTSCVYLSLQFFFSSGSVCSPWVILVPSVSWSPSFVLWVLGFQQ